MRTKITADQWSASKQQNPALSSTKAGLPFHNETCFLFDFTSLGPSGPFLVVLGRVMGGARGARIPVQAWTLSAL